MVGFSCDLTCVAGPAKQFYILLQTRPIKMLQDFVVGFIDSYVGGQPLGLHEPSEEHPFDTLLELLSGSPLSTPHWLVYPVGSTSSSILIIIITHGSQLLLVYSLYALELLTE